MSDAVDDHFIAALQACSATAPAPGRDDNAPVRPGSSLTVADAMHIFDSQIGSRHLDLAARALRADGHGFYTIGSAGHEANATVAAALRPTDPALLHYRSGGFFLQRARQHGGERDALRDVLLGIVSATVEPMSGGRHKVFGRYDLNIIPQTSTIASHLPRALGTAFLLGQACAVATSPWPSDAVVACSFGDASANHSTAVGAINAASNATYRGLDVPLLLVCEDNGIGISTKTPQGWIANAYAHQPGLTYFAADGADVVETFAAAAAAVAYVRHYRRPAFLHLSTVRLMGHAGSDYEPGYRSPREISGDYGRDPVLGTARMLVEQGHRSAGELLDLYEQKRATVMGLATQVCELPQLDSPSAVMEPLKATLRTSVRASRTLQCEHPAKMTLAQAINTSLHDVLREYPQALVFGEDVARKGGVYGLTRGLQKSFGAARVFDTILDEQTILGLALGAGVNGLLAMPEIQYLAYVHNALDQIRGEAATLQFFSNGQYRNPAVIRIAGYGFQKGFGGHFHNDDSVAALLDIPGIIVASPSHPDDAAIMLRACARAAVEAGAVCVYLEPIALYHTRDLHREGDGGWLTGSHDLLDATVGTARTYGDGEHLSIVTFGNGVPMSLRVADVLRRTHGIRSRVIDLRWLSPLPIKDVLREATATGHVLIVDETRRSGGVGQQVLAELIDNGYSGALARVCSYDSFIPLGDAALQVLVSEDAIERAAMALVGRPRR
ncbi:MULTISPECIES: thiamine pyrophosphate-dependent enzyme [unclassified Mycolicibacterium]|uniref:thiamine pyrophosphate-dependent enzyme n=1 Tax=unclassified Mycolicibacterium TaxID=2636767 RepID=UPI0012DFD320|nr:MULTISPECIES: thiamine pyrophosphate-dependent enzyme [unclassified Mycolicibacterium]MUL83073.1 MFS transporter [Mycolicibacterium sp. CBMA 329]MUL89408.1 MFS transporter [Mycolicibacterium sp. CBMA 331]MUL99097.1 MFS transporter [Mycolicibacterium sp. CBMA 334]MUM24723.1 MFS transporter [Mycolicibacterium sp. CBMA 295]MUM38924.1 MFS transporter [Mycolicibacterium sp. CBMA 247]